MILSTSLFHSLSSSKKYVVVDFDGFLVECRSTLQIAHAFTHQSNVIQSTSVNGVIITEMVANQLEWARSPHHSHTTRVSSANFNASSYFCSLYRRCSSCCLYKQNERVLSKNHTAAISDSTSM